MRDAAALHVREAGVGIAAQMEVGIDDRSAPRGFRLGPEAARAGRQ